MLLPVDGWTSRIGWMYDWGVQYCLITFVGADPENVQKICELPQGVDITVWQYEHIRQFILELNLLIV